MKINIKRILCPTDFSPSSEYAMRYAVAIAERHGAVIELLHITEPSAYERDTPLEGDATSETFSQELYKHLDDIASSVEENVQIKTKLMSGIAYAEIVNRTKTWPADIIVIGTHGRTGMKHMLIGSIAEKVVRLASCPVCTVRHPDHVID